MATLSFNYLQRCHPTTTLIKTSGLLSRSKNGLFSLTHPSIFSYSLSFLSLEPKWLRNFAVHAENPNRNVDKQQLNLSVLRFTLGIPGFDESNLPRLLGSAFGFLLLLNHFLGVNSVTPAQLRSEVVGICLAAFSITLPYIGKFLKSANPVERQSLPEGNQQIFLLPESVSDTVKEDLAWVSYVLLRNTNTISVLIYVNDALCVRGYWNTPPDASKAQLTKWFKENIEQIGFASLNEALYFPQMRESDLQNMLPKGAVSVLVEPVLGVPENSKPSQGFLLLASSMGYAYLERDRAWIRALANKFRTRERKPGNS
ncbi:hypothetical protein AMTRI_Chr09g22680 [Amborella trichopoda]